jgi:hypothetical protein
VPAARRRPDAAPGDPPSRTPASEDGTLRPDLPLGTTRTAGLVDVLDRVLDKGLLIAGDIKVALAEVELLTIRIRLIVCSMDKAQEMGLDWWKHDAHLTPGRQTLSTENEALRRQVRALERRLAAMARGPGDLGQPPAPGAGRGGARRGTPRRRSLTDAR